MLDVRSREEWETWLEEHHEEVTEGVWLRLFRKGRPESSLSYDEALEVALCFGWIDGQVKKHDDVSRVQRFTPRRSRSTWSKRNVARAELLLERGLVRPAGLRQIEAARADGRWDDAYDPPSAAVVPDDFLVELAKHPKAAAFFETLTKRHTFPIAYRLQAARRPETRAKRIAAIIEMFERGETFT